jgi:uncharacterized protein YbaR (Trm112 family)
MELDRLLPLLACPACRGPLVPAGGELQCPTCPRTYPVRGGVPILLPPGDEALSEAGDAFWFREDTREKVARRNRLVGLFRFPNPAVRSDHPVRTKEVFRDEVLGGTGTILNLGSGLAKRFDNPNVVNLDISPHENTDVVGDGLALPLASDAFHGAVLDSVLEHVRDPWTMADELYRVLRPGGFVLVHAPFLYPYHGAPHDYFRFTDRGLREVFARFEEEELDSDRLPGRAVQEILRAYAGIWSDRRYPAFLFRFLAAWLLLPYKAADLYLKRKGKTHLVVTGFSYLGRKPRG